MTGANDPESVSEMPALLLIEDDPAVAAFILNALQTFFHVDVLLATTADEARKLWHLRNGRVVAVLSDLNLPGESGLSVVRDLTSERHDVLIVFTTGDVYREPEIVASMGVGVRLLSKPFRPLELRAILGAILPYKEM